MDSTVLLLTDSGLSVGVFVDDFRQRVVFLPVFADDFRFLQLLFALFDFDDGVLQIVVDSEISNGIG